MSIKENLGINQIGLGAGGMTSLEHKNEAIATIHEALDQGVHFINTADFYGAGVSEMIIGEALKGHKRDEAFVSVKTGMLVTPQGQMYGLDVDPFHIKNYVTHSLKRLNLEYIDLYQPGRIDLGIPVEETVGAIAELVKEGYVKHIGLTQVDAETLRRANQVHPISLVEMEYSLFNREIENELIPTARELGIDVAAFGVLAHGMLSGKATKESTKHLSHYIPIFSAENIDQNLQLVEGLRGLAEQKGVTIAQLAIAWMLRQGDDILTIIGASKRTSLRDSLKAANVSLTDVEINLIESLIAVDKIAGASFPSPQIKNSRIVTGL